MWSIRYISLMDHLTPELKIVLFTVCSTLLVLGLVWGAWSVVSSINTFIKTVERHTLDIVRLDRFVQAENAAKLAKRLYNKKDLLPPVPPVVTHAPFFLRESEPPPLPTMDATNWDDDDDRASAQTHVKGS